MVKHVILWQLKDELSAEEKAAVKAVASRRGWKAFPARFRGLWTSMSTLMLSPLPTPT